MRYPLYSSRQQEARRKAREQHPERITPADYHLDATRRRIADACMAAVGANPDDVCHIDVTDTGAAVWEYVTDRSSHLGWVPMLVNVGGRTCNHCTFLMRRRPVRL